MHDRDRSSPALLRAPHAPRLVLLLAGIPALLAALLTPAGDERAYAANLTDAIVFRTAVELLEHGRSPYDARAHSQQVASELLDGQPPPYVIPFAYPPNALPLLLPYGFGSLRGGLVLFVALSTLALLAAAWQLCRQLELTRLSSTALMLAIGSSGPVLFNAMLGQTGSLLAACVLAYCAWSSRRPGAAGIALGLMAFKPQYALPLGLIALLQRRWGTVAAAGATFATLTLLSGLMFGFEAWPDFVRAAAGPNPTGAYMCNWFPLAAAVLPSEWIDVLRWPVMLGGVVLVVTLAPRLARPAGPGHEDLRMIALASAIAPLVSPNTHPYDMSLLVLPVMVCAGRYGPRAAVPAAVMVAWALLLLLPPPLRWLIPLLNLLLVALLLAPAAPLAGRTRRLVPEAISAAPGSSLAR